MTDPAPTLFTRRVLKGEVGTTVMTRPKGVPGDLTYVPCPSCDDKLHWDINNQWACKCGYRCQAKDEIP